MGGRHKPGPQPIAPPELVYGNIVLVGSEIEHIDPQWGDGVTEVASGYVRRIGGTGPRVQTGVTTDPYVAEGVGDIIEWFSTGEDAEGRRTTVYTDAVTVWAIPWAATLWLCTGPSIPANALRAL